MSSASSNGHLSSGGAWVEIAGYRVGGADGVGSGRGGTVVGYIGGGEWLAGSRPGRRLHYAQARRPSNERYQNEPPEIDSA